ncbi:MAG: hypothetical protein ABI389_02995 [Rhodanobacter sp.]
MPGNPWQAACLRKTAKLRVERVGPRHERVVELVPNQTLIAMRALESVVRLQRRLKINEGMPDQPWPIPPEVAQEAGG